jgi:hypothetical protein
VQHAQSDGVGEWEKIRIIEHPVTSDQDRSDYYTGPCDPVYIPEGFTLLEIRETDRIVEHPIRINGEAKDYVETVRILVYIVGKRRDAVIDDLRDKVRELEVEVTSLGSKGVTQYQIAETARKKAEEWEAKWKEQSNSLDDAQAKLDQSAESRRRMEEEIAKVRSFIGDKAWKEALGDE